MLQRAPYNLNAMSHDTAEALIRQALEDGVNLKRVCAPPRRCSIPDLQLEE